MIFHKMYTGTPVLVGGTLGPNHRAFVGNDGIIRLTGPGSDFEARLMGTGSNSPVPNFDGNGDLASNFGTLGAEYKWSNQATLMANTAE